MANTFTQTLTIAYLAAQPGQELKLLEIRYDLSYYQGFFYYDNKLIRMDYKKLILSCSNAGNRTKVTEHLNEQFINCKLLVYFLNSPNYEQSEEDYSISISRKEFTFDANTYEWHGEFNKSTQTYYMYHHSLWESETVKLTFNLISLNGRYQEDIYTDTST